jgi:hypothetical protein
LRLKARLRLRLRLRGRRVRGERGEAGGKN